MIIEGKKLREHRTERPDALVIGSGAGGAVTAAKLAAGGMKVVVIEEGGYHTRADFTPHEGEMFPLLYQEHGNRATSDQGIMLLQGRAYGGSTTINWTACLRPPRQTLEHWREHHGVEGLTEQALQPHIEAVEERLNVHTDDAYVNANNEALLRGCEKLGWQVSLVARNVRDCEDLGVCGLGCPADARLSMHLTYLPDAEAKGAVIYTNARAERLELERSRVSRVVCQLLDEEADKPTPYRLVVEPKICVLACGAINTPALLLRSRVGNDSGLVGRRTFLHPTVAAAGIHREPSEGMGGSPLTVSCHQFAYPEDGSMGYFIECPQYQPMLAGIALPGFGAEHRRLIEKSRHFTVNIALLKDGFGDEERGATVTLKPSGYPKVDYHYTNRLWDGMRRALGSMAEIQLAAGATEAWALHEEQRHPIKNTTDLGWLRRARLEPGRISIFSAHQMGGCPMGSDAKRSVVRSDLRHHQIENLWVIDASVFPTALGVNPQVTIFALASWGTQGIIDNA